MLTNEEIIKLCEFMERVQKTPTPSNDDKMQLAKRHQGAGEKLLNDKKHKEAFDAFDIAGRLYKDIGDHYNSSRCFASAGTCWLINCGEEILWNASSRYESAGDEAAKGFDYEYAKYLYEQSAALARKDNLANTFSRCFYKSKLAATKHAFLIFTNSKKLKEIPGKRYSTSPQQRIKHFGIWLIQSFLFLIWGYGEKPYRAFISSIFIMLLSALAYYVYGEVMTSGQLIKPSIFDSLYLSMTTFTTLGYGDFVPVGMCKFVAMVEAFSGIFLVPLFLVGLIRKYIGIFS